MIEKPLYGNPLAGGAMIRPQDDQLQGDALVERMQMRMQQRDVKTPAFLAYFKDVMDTKGYPTKTMEEYGGQFPLSGLLEPANPTFGAQQATPSNPIGQLSQVDSEEELIQSGQFLPDLPPSNNFVDDMRDKTLPQISDPAGLRKAIRTVNPIVSGPEEYAIASTQTVNPFQEQFTGFKDQLTDFGDQFSTLGDRLTKLEEGIASLLQNRGQQFNFGMQPRFDFGMQPRFNMSGLGYFFNPQGGFYG
jgi:hypothetical protein